jgi:hypothetical protein
MRCLAKEAGVGISMLLFLRDFIHSSNNTTLHIIAHLLAI